MITQEEILRREIQHWTDAFKQQQRTWLNEVEQLEDELAKANEVINDAIYLLDLDGNPAAIIDILKGGLTQ